MNKSIVAIIHARGGSKRVPLKNLAQVGGKPLLAYPIELCKASKFISRIILSTDHDGIMETGKKWGAEVPFRRPADISEDVPSELVTLHALQTLKEKEGTWPDIAVTLTPATPFTRIEDLDKGIHMLIENNSWDAVVTVRPALEHPEWMMWLDAKKGTFSTVLGNSLDGKYNVSQNLRPAYYPAGSFFINRVSAFMQQKSLYGKIFGAVLLSQNEIDIDTPEDLIRAQEKI